MDLQALKNRFGNQNESKIYDEHFNQVAQGIINKSGTRQAPYAGMPTLLNAPARVVNRDAPEIGDLDVALPGIPMDLAISNRNGCRFGPRALHMIERIGSYNHALRVAPQMQLNIADVGDVPFRSRYDLEGCHQDIKRVVDNMSGQVSCHLP